MIERIFTMLEQGNGDLIAVLAIVFGVVGGVLICGFITIASVRVARTREQTRREVAAYVAEGSITSEDAERILQPAPWYCRNAGELGEKFGKGWKAAVKASGAKPAGPAGASSRQA